MTSEPPAGAGLEPEEHRGPLPPPVPNGESAPAPVRAAQPAPDDDRLLRALADLDNLRKRFDREIERTRADERARVVAEIIEIVDDLERALEVVDSDPAAVAAGIGALRDRSVATLARLGYQRYGRPGESFDPARHDAVATAADESAAPGSVTRVLRPGYEDHEGVLRPAAVVVAGKRADDDRRRDG
ncbi:MAG: heat shock protein GrpE [Acidimicrobiaceae bacterium]|jgi:molecular chaperone GrpE|nr:heat shock protein GrpE [Acidimicrobiaceae bacterium]